MTVISVISSGPQGAPSWATVGATGNYKPSSYGDDVSLAIAACLDAHGQCDLQPGSYTAETAMTRSTAYEMIRASQGANITIGNSAAVGFLTHSGAKFQMEGVRIIQSANVNDQIAVHITGDEPTFTRTIFETTTAIGSSANPMTGLKLGTRTQGILAPMLTNVRFLPNKGVISLHVAGDPDSGTTVGNGIQMSACHFGTETGTPRKFWKGIYLDGAGEGNLDFRAHGLGDGTDVGYAMVHQATDDTESEAHHMRMNVNCELVTAQHVLRLDGPRFTTIQGIIGRCLGSDTGQGTIHITRNTTSGTAAGTVTIGMLDIHNSATSSGRSIWIEQATTVILGVINMSLINGRAIRVGSGVDTLVIGGPITFTGIATGSLVEFSATPTRYWGGPMFNRTGAQLYTSIPSGTSVFPHGFCAVGASVTAASVAVTSGTTADNLRQNVVW